MNGVTRCGRTGNRASAKSAAAPGVPPPPTGQAAAPDAPATDAAAATRREGWDLVAAAQTGDSLAFAELYDRYVDAVFRYALFRLHDRGLAEDVTSETFLRALRRITSISYRGRDVGAWFITIARNLVLDHVKSSRYRFEVTTAEPALRAPVASGPESQVLAGVTSDELMRCIQQLGTDQRECILLRFLQGLSVAETAALMGRNEGAIKALQHRAVRRLSQLMPAEFR